ncbi:MAG: enamine deaminase RidA (YjgF/YER057c/UK114 family) [Arcticibacterium sp.]|jgi:enamine deaminase RidA (YjgF/YER057c/UK114 family)
MLLDKVFEKYADKIPPAPKPGGVYKPLIITGNMVFVSGHGPYLPDGDMHRGKIPSEVDLEFAREAALQTGLAMLTTLKNQFGSLSKIKRVIKLLGMVNCDPDFENHPQVINGCSELFEEVWGSENGLGSRSAVGFVSLPGRITVEIEGQFELH